jgi:AcrR family transcriptional regulator
MSSVQGQTQPAAVTTRRRPRRRDDRIDALADAALDELREHGYEGLTVRNAARRAGLAPATAYTYFGSKDHLVAEVFWRRLQHLAVPTSRRASALTRLNGALDNLIEVITGEPALVAASTIAVLADDPDVDGLRLRIGARINEHLADALGDRADPAVLRALHLAVSGALLQSGMGFLDYDDLGPRLHEVARLLLRPT